MRVVVAWDGAVVAGASLASPLRRTTSVLELRDGAAPGLIQKSPELTRYDVVVLQRPLGPDTAFADWAAVVTPFPIGPTPSPPEFRKDVTIASFDDIDAPLASYVLRAAWPAGYETHWPTRMASRCSD
ncbi:MAG: phage tail protein [Geminicoccaceae bacterium]